MRFRTLSALGAARAAVAAIVPTSAGAITGGGPDTIHKSVGLVRFTTTEGRFRCSGTLISPTVVLTAGHCTEGPATGVYVRSTMRSPSTRSPAGITPRRRPCARPTTSPAPPIRTRPGTAAQLSKQHDQGVVVLDAPASTKWPGIIPRRCLRSAIIDANQGELKNDTFTLVGYGVDIGEKKAQVVVGEVAPRPHT